MKGAHSHRGSSVHAALVWFDSGRETAERTGDGFTLRVRQETYVAVVTRLVLVTCTS